MHKPVSVILKALAITSVVAALAWFVPAGSASEWETSKAAGFDLHYGDGNETDASMMGQFFKTAYDRIAKEFSTHEPEELLKGIELDVYLHPRAGEMASQSHATMTSNLQKQDYKAAIHLLTPSAHMQQGDTASASSERTKDYMFRQAVHEISAVYVQRLILQKPKGWRYDDAAPWFLQGYDEYLSGIHGRRTEDTTLTRYRASMRRNPNRVRFGTSIRVRDPYRDGAVVVQFLHESFGREAVQNIWLSPEPTFDKALVAALNTDYAALEKRWQNWLSER